MKKYLRDYMKKPILEKILIRLGAGLFLGVLYMLFIRKKTGIDANFFNYPLLSIGAVCLMLGWFNYLRFDGIKVNLEVSQHNKEKKIKKKNKHKMKTMIDYTDEDIREDQPLLEEEKLVCNMIANLVSGFILVTPSIILLIVELI